VIVDALLETGWSWEQWCATPKWIQQTTVDTIGARRARDQREQDSQQQQVDSARR
jgi:hypothetical protein